MSHAQHYSWGCKFYAVNETAAYFRSFYPYSNLLLNIKGLNKSVKTQ